MLYSISDLYSFFFNDTATTEIYTLSLHDALPISIPAPALTIKHAVKHDAVSIETGDRKSTRLNSSHLVISYAVFCLKKTITDRTFYGAASTQLRLKYVRRGRRRL